MIIPLSTLTHLRISVLKKVALCSLFALGTFVIIATTIRAVVALKRPVSISRLLIWSAVEVAVAFIVANAPALRPLLPWGRDESAQCSPDANDDGDQRRLELYGVMTKSSVIVTVEAGTPDDERMLDGGEITVMRTVQITVDADGYNNPRTDISRGSISP
jgi:hypothetical protein